jgi:hypothetical protein
MFRLRSVHNPDGGVVYENSLGTLPGSDPGEVLYFQELTADEASLEGRCTENNICLVVFPDQNRFVLACVYRHLPLAGYPRLFQTSLDDLPQAIRSGSFYSQGVLFFPAYDKVPEAARPLYAFLVAGAAPNAPPSDVLRDLALRFGTIHTAPGGTPPGQ